MRNYLILLLAILSIACTKEPQYATVTFGLSGVESGSLTKVSSDAVSAALDATAPSGPFALRLVSKSNPLRVYNITTGTPATIAVDSYTVTGSGLGEELAEITGGKLYASPKWSVSCDVDVTSGGAINVSASFPCVALVIDKSVTDHLEIANGPNMVRNFAVGGTDAVGVVYIVGSWIYNKPLYLYSYPVDTVNKEVVCYVLVNGDFDGMVNVQNGRWYNFAPGDIETVSGSFGVTFNGFVAGQ